MTSLPDVLSTREVADALDVHPMTVRRWARDGLLKPINMPGRLKRFKREDIEALFGTDVLSGSQ